MASNQAYSVTKQRMTTPSGFSIVETQNFAEAALAFSAACQETASDGALLVSLGQHTWDADASGNIIWFNEDGGIWQEGEVKAHRKVRLYVELAESITWAEVYRAMDADMAVAEQGLVREFVNA